MDDLKKNNYECWMSKDGKVLSFHYISDYLHKKFVTYNDFFSYVIFNSQRGCKIQ